MIGVGAAIDAWHGKPFYTTLLAYIKGTVATNKATVTPNAGG
jgi:hypothetical protein